MDRVEFLTAMLVQMNDLDKEKDIDPWLKRFDELDADGSGALDEEVSVLKCCVFSFLTLNNFCNVNNIIIKLKGKYKSL